MTSPVIPDIDSLDERSRTIFRNIVDTYLETGDPVGSRKLSRDLPMALSPASVRNVMADLEDLGLIYAPHTSAGRLPTESGLRLFVDGLLQVGEISGEERRAIEARMPAADREGNGGLEGVLSKASEMISGLSLCAGLVVADPEIKRIKHIQFVALEPGRALVILVGDDDSVENRIVDLPAGLPDTVLEKAANYLNAHLKGLSFAEARQKLSLDLQQSRDELDEITQRVISAGFATWSGAEASQKSLIVSGQSNLLANVSAQDDIARIRRLFEDLERKQDLMQLLELTDGAEGVKIFIGSESQLFSLSGSSLIVAPIANTDSKIVGAIGVIGPTRINYARIIPMVDYTARLVGRAIT